MRRKASPLPGTGGSPPSVYVAPFEEEGKFFEAALKPSDHVDEAGPEHHRGAWLGSPADPSRLSAVETSLMTLSAEKVCMQPPVAGDSLIQVVPWLVNELVLLCPKVGLDKRCKNQPKGDVFPLLTNTLHSRDITIAGMVRGMCLALNLFYGVAAENDFHPTSLQVEQTSWQTIDYCGDEVLCAQSTSWANLAPAMPAEIASVELAEVCELGCRHYMSKTLLSISFPGRCSMP